jgi:hypothetical protein
VAVACGRTTPGGACNRLVYKRGAPCGVDHATAGPGPAVDVPVTTAATADPFAPPPSASGASRLPPQPFDDHAELAGHLNTLDDPDAPSWGWNGLNGPWSDGYEIAFEFDEPVRDPVQLVAYYMRGPVAMGPDGFDGEQQGVPLGQVDEHGRARAWRYHCDMTKSRRDDIDMALDGLCDHVADGSPVRKTDKAGPGTKGTRAVDGTGMAPRVAIR